MSSLLMACFPMSCIRQPLLAAVSDMIFPLSGSGAFLTVSRVDFNLLSINFSLLNIIVFGS